MTESQQTDALEAPGKTPVRKVAVREVAGDPLQWLAFGFGSGLLPKAPGTWGTLATLPIWWLMADLSVANYAIILAVMIVAGIFICDYSAKKLEVHDHPGIVWDEICGYLLTMWLLPNNWWWALAGFVLFRIFDIRKPWPIRELDSKVHGGLGIMVDDLVAAVFAGGAALLLVWLIG